LPVDPHSSLWNPFFCFGCIACLERTNFAASCSLERVQASFLFLLFQQRFSDLFDVPLADRCRFFPALFFFFSSPYRTFFLPSSVVLFLPFLFFTFQTSSPAFSASLSKPGFAAPSFLCAPFLPFFSSSAQCEHTEVVCDFSSILPSLFF